MQQSCPHDLLPSVLLHRVQDTEDVQEEVDNVQVEVDGCQDVLLRGELLHQQVGVVDDEAAEDQSPSSSEHQLCAVTVEEELQRQRSQLGTISRLYYPTYFCIHILYLYKKLKLTLMKPAMSRIHRQAKRLNIRT